MFFFLRGHSPVPTLHGAGSSILPVWLPRAAVVCPLAFQFGRLGGEQQKQPKQPELSELGSAYLIGVIRAMATKAHTSEIPLLEFF